MCGERRVSLKAPKSDCMYTLEFLRCALEWLHCVEFGVLPLFKSGTSISNISGSVTLLISSRKQARRWSLENRLATPDTMQQTAFLPHCMLSNLRWNFESTASACLLL